jgi:2-polyprenyl-3-methyl-5-hydroxy-6-metoxy-1,4-benzoquinol methylase
MTGHTQAHSIHTKEVEEGNRFEFGKNWAKFLRLLNDTRIHRAEQSLKDYLGVDSLEGLRFLDIGCGSGLFSLAARRLGAKVHSFDYDPHSANCARELKRRFFNGDADWTIEEGSVLDPAYLESLGRFDVVYSWGVLHHTGQMWKALAHAEGRVAPGGALFIAIYNDQGVKSKVWTVIKRAYCKGPKPVKALLLLMSMLVLWLPGAIRDLLIGKPFWSFRNYHMKNRGMSPYRDLEDWVGGYPFEVAKPEEILDFYNQRGYRLMKLKTCGGKLGCNEFVFKKER